MEQHWKSIMDQEKESSGTRFRQFCPPKMKQNWNDKRENWGSKGKSSDSAKNKYICRNIK
jgi:hypothetical protein